MFDKYKRLVSATGQQGILNLESGRVYGARISENNFLVIDRTSAYLFNVTEDSVQVLGGLWANPRRSDIPELIYDVSSEWDVLKVHSADDLVRKLGGFSGVEEGTA